MGGRGRRMLLIHKDSDALWTLACRVMRSGWSVTCCRDAMEAVHLLETAHYDLLCTEPEIMGPNAEPLVDWVRGVVPDVKVVAIAGLDDSCLGRCGPGEDEVECSLEQSAPNDLFNRALMSLLSGDHRRP
jgi:hypothetical protein